MQRVKRKQFKSDVQRIIINDDFEDTDEYAYIRRMIKLNKEMKAT